MLPHIPRPHLSATSQRKYTYHVRVHSLDLRKPLTATAGAISVLWTRGSKTAVTSERSFASAALSTYEEDLSLICTLFVEEGAGVRFAEKLCTFAAVESRTVGKLAGVRTLGKCKVDISEYAAADGLSTTPKPLELRLSRNGAEIGALKISISCRWVRESLSGGSSASAPGASSVAPAASSAQRGLSSVGESLRFSDLSEFSDSEFSDTLSECSLDEDSSERLRLAELEPWANEAQAEAQAHTPIAVIDLRNPPGSGDTTTPVASPPAPPPPAPPPAAATALPAAAASPAPAASGMVRVSRGDPAPMVRVSRGDGGGGAGATRVARFAQPTAAPAPAPAPAPSETPPRASSAIEKAAASAASSPAPPAALIAAPALAEAPPPNSPRRRAATSYAPPTHSSPGSSLGTEAVGGSSMLERRGSGASENVRGSGSSSSSSSAPFERLSGRHHTVGGCSASIVSSGLEASERARIEAERRELEAQASASMALHKRMTARLEAEREAWRVEKEAMSKELAVGREALLEQQTEARRRELEARKVMSERDEARAEASRLKAERGELQARLQGGSGADGDDALAVGAQTASELQGKLSASEAQLAEVSRKMTKAHKKQENLLTQFEAEIELLSDKVDQLEDECCEAEQARLIAESAQAEAEGKQREASAELERQSVRAAIQPAGTQELADQLEMANEVKQMLVSEMALFTDELATLKVQHAQTQVEKDEAVLRVRTGEEKSRRLRLHLTRLEVQIAEWNAVRAEEEEEKSQAFKAAMQAQEERILELERIVAEAAPGGRKRWPW